jgi:hypothetical protein
MKREKKGMERKRKKKIIKKKTQENGLSNFLEIMIDNLYLLYY